MNYPNSQWYAIAWDREISKRPLARRVCDLDVVLFRKGDGTIAALADRCWHRGAPLSMGRVIGNGQIQCPYHGLTYDADGRCSRIPGQSRIPSAASVPAYQTTRQFGLVWIWIGDSTSAADGAVPDLHWNDDPGWTGDGGYLRVACDYRLLIDNLMDLTHETIASSASIRDEKLQTAPIDVTATHDEVVVQRVVFDHQPAPFWKRAIVNEFNSEANCDRWQIIRYHPPTTITVDVGVAITGTGGPGGARDRAVSGFVLNALTPETATSTHHFWSFVRDFDLENRGLTRETQQAIGAVFAEDAALLERQQINAARAPIDHSTSLELDRGPEYARRLLARRMAEQA